MSNNRGKLKMRCSWFMPEERFPGTNVLADNLGFPVASFTNKSICKFIANKNKLAFNLPISIQSKNSAKWIVFMQLPCY